MSDKLVTQQFTNKNPFYLHKDSVSQALLFPFHRWENWGTFNLGDFPNHTASKCQSLTPTQAVQLQSSYSGLLTKLPLTIPPFCLLMDYRNPIIVIKSKTQNIRAPSTSKPFPELLLMSNTNLKIATSSSALFPLSPPEPTLAKFYCTHLGNSSPVPTSRASVPA